MKLQGYTECVDGSDGTRTLVTAEEIEAKKQQRLEYKERFDALARVSEEKFHLLNTMLVSQTSERCIDLLDKIAAAQTQNKNNWHAREAYREIAESRNKSLSFLLERAADAAQQFDAEGNKIEAKAGGKDAKGKKK